jgi:MYXO-CTERM domain-containing protein
LRTILRADPALHKRIALDSVGGFRRQADAVTAAGPLSRFDFAPRLAERANGPFELRLGSSERDLIALAPQGASDASLQLLNGRALYEGVWPSTDLLWLARGRSVEQVLILHGPQAPSSIAWRWDAGQGFVVPVNEDGGVIVRDTTGAERVRIAAPEFVGADGQRARGSVQWTNGFLVVDISAAKALTPPAAGSIPIDLPEQQLYGAPPAQVKARVMVLMDTSGTMGYYFADPKQPLANTPGASDVPAGDGSKTYTDVNGTAALYPGKLQGTVYQGTLSRLYAAKSAVSNAVNGYSGSIDFGLMTFPFQFCAFNQPKCFPCQVGTTGFTCLYANAAGNQWDGVNWNPQDCLHAPNILAMPGDPPAPMLAYMDGVEVFTSGTGGKPTNPEIRAAGPTPLYQSINAARTNWFDTVKGADTKASCRTYALIVLTDGSQSPDTACDPNCTKDTDCPSGACSGTSPANPGVCLCQTNAQCTTAGYQCQGYVPNKYWGFCVRDPAPAAASLYSDNPSNPVKTHVIGVAVGADAKTQLDGIAVAGHTGSARIANDQNQIEAAFADISATSVKYETCNGLDDTCNDLIDEGLGAYQECLTGTECKTGSTCNLGRCSCTSDTQCLTGFSCGGGFCRPSCSVGMGKCLRTGVRKCSAGTTACCVNDGQATCAPLTPGASSIETCNGVDDNCDGIIDEGGVCQTCQPMLEVCDGKDNDCDNVVDNALIDTGKPCGNSIGICTPGLTACVNGALQCQGGVQPGTEICNGLDDNCDGNVDGMKADCYTGPLSSKNVGICVGGQWQCTAVVGSGIPSWGPCIGQILPGAEVCNGLDDNCNGTVDDVPGANSSCCPSNKCGVGTCVAGTMKCSGGSLQCIGGQGPGVEVCDGKDNDCNGVVDDVAGGQIGQTCCLSGLCPVGVCAPGVWGCGTNGLTCVGETKPSGEICDTLDNDCNGVVDDIPGKGLACCKSGACGKGICTSGVLQCVGNDAQCVGEVLPETEICDGIDNNCNTVIDDVPGKGESCCPPGSLPGQAPGACSKGICKPGTMQCQGSDLACVGGVAPALEICDGIDNDCDGEIDEKIDVDVNDPGVGKDCDAPVAPADKPPCKAGKTACVGAKIVCSGAVKPVAEICNGIDENCDGTLDDSAPCPPKSKCLEAACHAECKAGEFPCPGGQVCKVLTEGKYCFEVAKDAGADTGAGGSGGSKPDAATDSAAGGAAGTAGAAGKAGSGGKAGAGGSAAADSGADGAAAPPAAAESEDKGGCGCRTAGASAPNVNWALGLLAMAAVWAARRRGGK